MVGKIVGTAAFLSLIALVWVMVLRADWDPWAVFGAAVLFLFIGGFAAIDTRDWRRKGQT